MPSSFFVAIEPSSFATAIITAFEPTKLTLDLLMQLVPLFPVSS
jgi:hypothetical protein